jgi:3-isopropylmalate dehydratase small subunit
MNFRSVMNLRSRLDKQLFRDWRDDTQGYPEPDFILNQLRAKGAQVLLANEAAIPAFRARRVASIDIAA